MKSMTLEMLISIKSNLKLDLIDLKPDLDQKKTNFLTHSRINDDEIHFIKFEGKIPV